MRGAQSPSDKKKAPCWSERDLLLLEHRLGCLRRKRAEPGKVQRPIASRPDLFARSDRAGRAQPDCRYSAVVLR